MGRKQASKEGIVRRRERKKKGCSFKDITIGYCPSISPKKLRDKRTNSDFKHCIVWIRVHTMSGGQTQSSSIRDPPQM